VKRLSEGIPSGIESVHKENNLDRPATPSLIVIQSETQCSEESPGFLKRGFFGFCVPQKSSE